MSQPDLARATALTQYLHDNIPLTAAMAIRVEPTVPGRLRLSAPQAPNRNPHNTVFGGSLATLAIAAGWTLLFEALQHEGVDAALVIQHFACDYRAPAAAEFSAEAALPEDWPVFVEQLLSRKRARLSLAIQLSCAGQQVLTAHARYVAMLEA